MPLPRAIAPLLFSAAFVVPLTPSASAATYVYVANSGDGDLSAFRLDTDKGELVPLGRMPGAPSVSPLAHSPDGRMLYAAGRSSDLAVLSYAIDPASGALTRRGSAPLPADMCHIALDPSGRYLLGASYGGDMLSIQRIGSDGLVEAEPVARMLTGRNAHAFRAHPTNGYVYATNLGSDRVVHLRFDAASGKVTQPSGAPVGTPQDFGPRHMVFSPDGRFLYVNSEYQGGVIAYAVDAASGALTEKAHAHGLPADLGLPADTPRDLQARASGSPAKRKVVWAADLRLTPDGRFLYMSERTGNLVSLFRIDPASGLPTYVASYPTEQQPRGFNIDPSGRYLIAAGEQSGHVSLYRISPQDGSLALAGRYPVGIGANWVEVVQPK